MREAVGGSILFYIILGFLAVYIIFIGLIMNYAATYRASNFVITSIEQTEGHAASDTKKLCDDLRERNYNNSLTISCEEPNGTGAVYKVTTNVKFEVPLISIAGNLKINNETKTIYGVSCQDFGFDSVTVNCGAGL